MMIRKIVQTTLLPCAVLAALAFAPSSVTSTARADVGDCPQGLACVYENNDFNRGASDHRVMFTPAFGSVPSSESFVDEVWRDGNNTRSSDEMDEASSVQNNSSCAITLWQNADMTGAHVLIGAGQSDGFLGNNDIGDNRASAIEVC